VDQVCRYAEDGTPVTDPDTLSYIALAERVSGNDLYALLALAEGMRDSQSIEPDGMHAPQQPVLFATGAQDPVLDGSRRLARTDPKGSFFEIRGRLHLNAPGSRRYGETSLQCLRAEETSRSVARTAQERAQAGVHGAGDDGDHGQLRVEP